MKRWKNFLSCFVVWRTDTLNPEHSGSPAAGVSGSAKSQGVTQSFPGFVQTWQRVPGKHCRSHYLALSTVSPKYIFSHYSSVLCLQSKDKSPNQGVPVSRGIIMTHDCTLPSLVRTVETWSLPSSLQHHKTASCSWTSSLKEIWDLPCGQRRSPAHSCFCSFTDWDDLYVSLLTSSQLIQFSSVYFRK